MNKFFSPAAQEAQWVQQFLRESRRVSIFVSHDLIHYVRVDIKWYKKAEDRECALLSGIFADYGCYRADLHWDGVAIANVDV